MGQQNNEMDVESLKRSVRQRGSCLDFFLVISIVFLFVAMAGMAVGGVLFVNDLRTKLDSSPKTMKFETEKLTGDEPTYKMQNFVYLEVGSSVLQNYTMSWHPVMYLSGSSIGSNFVYDEHQKSLMPKQEGTYFIYIELNLTCIYDCKEGLLSMHVDDKLTCEVQLPAVADSKPVSTKCWTVSHIKGQRLLTQMTVPEGGLKNWKLELNGSGLGMFLVN
uniref:uncharacterized protein LOC124068892 n=1 Tax=Scatophagus argus TaxID=75038 RepID=UPI001ED84F9F|nr:uncharacterized protein LOC124068892 [Scatophagus argus]